MRRYKGVLRRAVNVVRQAGRRSGLDRFSLTMRAIANERMHVSVGDPKVRALLIGTGVAFGEYASDVLFAYFSPHAKDE